MTRVKAHHDPLEVPYIAWIVAAEEKIGKRRVELDLGAAIRGVLEKVPDQQRNILASLAQRRRPQDPVRHAIVKIGAKCAIPHALLQIAVGRAYQTELGIVPHIAADALVGVLLNDTQQLSLQGHRQFADLIEQQCAAVCEREGAVTRRDRPGKGAAFVTKQLAARQFRRQRRAIDDDKVGLVVPPVEQREGPSRSALSRFRFHQRPTDFRRRSWRFPLAFAPVHARLENPQPVVCGQIRHWRAARFRQR